MPSRVFLHFVGRVRVMPSRVFLHFVGRVRVMPSRVFLRFFDRMRLWTLANAVALQVMELCEGSFRE
jgi:hypothetical protein